MLRTTELNVGLEASIVVVVVVVAGVVVAASDDPVIPGTTRTGVYLGQQYSRVFPSNPQDLMSLSSANRFFSK